MSNDSTQQIEKLKQNLKTLRAQRSELDKQIESHEVQIRSLRERNTFEQFGLRRSDLLIINREVQDIIVANNRSIVDPSGESMLKHWSEGTVVSFDGQDGDYGRLEAIDYGGFRVTVGGVPMAEIIKMRAAYEGSIA